MIIKQISIFLENRSGRIYEVAKIFADKGINILAVSMAETADFGIMRMITDDSEKAAAILDANNFSFQLTPVIAVDVPDQPGGLAAVLRQFADAGINIEYMYSMPGREHDRATMIFRTENVHDAVGALQAQGVNLIKQQEMRNRGATNET